MTNKIYLRVADFNICLIFYNIELYSLKENLINHILTKYNKFICKQSQRNDYSIVFTDSSQINVIVKKDQTNYKRYFFLNHVFNLRQKKVFTTYFISEMQLEFIFKQIFGYLLATHNGFFMHGSAVLYKNSAYVFLGKSGAGKTTITNLLNNITKRLADDIFILRRIENKFFLFQTPFLEKKERPLLSNGHYRIDKIFLLHKSTITKIRKITYDNFPLKKLINQLILTTDDLGGIFRHNIPISLISKFFLENSFFIVYFSLDKKKLEDIFNSL